MARPWIKLYTEMLHDPKVGLLSAEAYRLFVQLMLKAGIVDEDGATDTTSALAWELRYQLADIKGMADELENAGVIYIDDDGMICITSWSKRQPPTTSADRMKRHRDNQQSQAKRYSDERVTSPKRHSDAIDKERDIEKEREGDARARANGASAAPSASPSVPEGATSHAATFKAITGHWVGVNMQDFLQQRLGERPDWEIVGWAYEQWTTRGYNPRNLRGVLDWYDKRLADPNWQPDGKGQPVEGAVDYGADFDTYFGIAASRHKSLRKAGAPEYFVQVVERIGRGKFQQCDDRGRSFLRAEFINAAKAHQVTP